MFGGGDHNPKTMKLQGEIRGHKVVVMIDPGATHNFLSLRVIEKARVVVSKGGDFEVSLGNGESVRGQGLCKEVEVNLSGGITVVEEFLPLGLGNADVILGVQWLEKLGPVTTNWKTHVMRFKVAGAPVTLVGDPTLEKTQISLKAMIRSLRKIGGGLLVEVCSVEKEEGPKEEGGEKDVPPFLAEVVKEYGEVFEKPDGLPPQRGHEHAIVLKRDAPRDRGVCETM